MQDATAIEILDRLCQATHTKSEAALANTLGISHQAIYNAKTKQKVPHSWIMEVAKRFGASIDWIYFGKDAPRTDQNVIFTSKDDDIMMIPMVEARLSAGSGSLEVDGESERSYAFRMSFLLRKGNPKEMVLMRVAGDSMEPEIMDHDVVLIDQSKKNIIPGRIFAVGFEEAIYLKRIDMLPGKIILKSSNLNYPSVELDIRGDMHDMFRVIGQVLWSGREYR